MLDLLLGTALELEKVSPEKKCPLIDGNKRHKAFCYLAAEFVPHWKCPKKEVLLCLIYFNFLIQSVVIVKEEMMVLLVLE